MGLSLAKEIGNMDDIKLSYMYFSSLDSLEGNFRSAYANYKLYVAYRDSVTNEENTKKMVEAQMQYEFDKKEQETKAEQEKKDLIAEKEKQKQKMFLWFTVCGLGVVVVIAGLIFRSLRLNKKKNKIISEQKEIVEKQKMLVEEKQKEITDSIKYASRIQKALITNERYITKKLHDLNN
jgi:hypothetical protein